MRRILRKGAALLCAFLCMIGCATTALAYTAIDTERETSLTITYGKENKPITNARFDLYRVADVSNQGYYTLSGDFKDYTVNLNDLDSSGWRSAAETLSAYARRDEKAFLQSGTTDSQGYLAFSKLDVGLYLVVGHKIKIGRYTYTPEPMLVLLPGKDKNDQWIYDLTAAPKYEEEYKPGGGDDGDDDTVTRKVLKKWVGAAPGTIPTEVVVQLLQDGSVYDTVTLSESNNWRYTWSDLDDDCHWQVVEYQVPDDYTVSVSREGITFVITNTLDKDTPPPNPSEPNIPGENIPDDPVPLGPGEPGEPTLPQTGTSWWLVPVLACGGMLLFMLGWMRRRNEEQDEK